MLVNGDRMLPAILRDIEAARSTIHISMFLWFRDQVGKEIAQVVMRKAREGVAVRILINVAKTALGDPFSTGEKTLMKLDSSMRDEDPHDVEPMCRDMRQAGAEVVDTNIDYDHVPSNVEPRLRSIASQIRSTIAIDDLHVDHRKLILIDGRVGYAGGANIGVQYMYHEPFDPKTDAHFEAEVRSQEQRPEPWLKWHDSLTRFVGPIVDDLEHQFHERFVLDGGQQYVCETVDHTELPQEIVRSNEACGSRKIASAQVFCNEPNDHPNPVRELYVRMIREAARSIFIENPYLYHPALVEALCEAKRARPELEVTLVLPAGKWSDNSFAFDAQQHEYARYLEQGIAVYEYQCHFNHLKLAVFDERWSIHGSTNGNFRSLEDDKDFELVVLVDDAPFARWILENVREVDVSHARAISHDDVHRALDGFRVRHRDPRTVLLYARREL